MNRANLLLLIFLVAIFTNGCHNNYSKSSSVDKDKDSGVNTGNISRNSDLNHDKYYYQQWYLDKNSTFYNQVGIDENAGIHSEYARSEYRGLGIKIAVIDDGLDMYHEDLTDALVASYDLQSGTSDVSHRNPFAFHGTAVSGIISARVNDIGIEGIAPQSSLIFLRYQDDMSDSQTIELFNKAVEFGADIIVCSWGTYNVSPAVKDKIIDISNNGRRGLGIPIIFAVGNENVNMGNDESAIDEVISVGASDIHNKRAWYSNYGDHLDILAPGGDYNSAITTLDDMGDKGTATLDPNYILYNDYFGFAGTSPAAAIVGGAIALIMEANPALTRAQIEEILKSTADKIGDKEYINGRNKYYGYGKINLDRAIQEAEARR